MLRGKQDQCPNCGKFIEYDAEGFYDRAWPYHDGAQTLQYCNENCCDAKRDKDQLVNFQIAHDEGADITDEAKHDTP